MIKALEEKVNNNLTLNSLEGKLDIKPIKEEIKKLIELDHEPNKRDLNLVIFGVKEELHCERGGGRGYISHSPDRIT